MKGASAEDNRGERLVWQCKIRFVLLSQYFAESYLIKIIPIFNSNHYYSKESSRFAAAFYIF